MNLEEAFQQAWRSLHQLWVWLSYQVRDNPLIVLMAAIIVVVLWRFLTPNPRGK
jgi:hypothetical protein